MRPLRRFAWTLGALSISTSIAEMAYINHKAATLTHPHLGAL